MTVQPLAPHQLYRRCNPEQLAGVTFDPAVDQVCATTPTLGQERVLESLQFGVGMAHHGYNIFVTGSPGVGKHQLIERVIGDHANTVPTPRDWCYIYNFVQAHKPAVLELPAGQGQRLKDDMAQMVERLLAAVPETFQAEDYQKRLREIREEYEEREQRIMEELAERAREQDISLLRTPMGFTLGPMKEGRLLGPKEYEKLPEEERAAIEAAVGQLNEELRNTLESLPRLQEEGREKMRELNREFARLAVDPVLDWLKNRWRNEPRVMEYLEAVHEHALENLRAFVPEEGNGQKLSLAQLMQGPQFLEYQVNVLVDNSECKGAPVVYEDNPTFQAINGRVEHVAHMGMLTTNFTLIKPGALHRANGGYLILDVRRLLSNPYAWEGLKRALRARELRIESLQDVLSLTSTISLEPEPIPLQVKVVLYGERLFYFLLKEYDPEFGQLFKVQADFHEDLPWSDENLPQYGEMLCSLASYHQLQPLTPEGMAACVEYSARHVQDSKRLSLNVASMADVLREADYWARQAGAKRIDRVHVNEAVARRRYRHGQVREQMLEQIGRDIVLIDTHGEAVGQANGLAVFRIGDEWFGRPSRISATARPGGRGVLDVERETALGGSIHSKGVLIITSLLSSRFARELPITLGASLVFEQSYGPVDGDSASAVEYCVLLSAIGQVPLRQSLAVTGSINQHGAIQAIGGVNDKIEGFFDVCQQAGLAGQGVVIPQANAQHLMLREDVVAACEAGQFHIYAVSRVEELMELLSGIPAGEPDSDGQYPENSFNGKVQARFDQWRKRLQREKQAIEDEKHAIESKDNGGGSNVRNA